MIAALAFALIAGLVAAALIQPLLAARTARPEGEAEITVYRTQLRELAAEQAAGTLDEGAAAAARLEIERRLLRAGARPAGAVESRAAPWAAAAIALGLIAGATLLYGRLGQPGLDDAPLAPRLTAEGQAAEDARLLATLERRVASSPEDGEAWSLLGRVRLNQGRYADAVAAFETVVRLQPDNPAAYLAAAEARVAANDGRPDAAARTLVAQAARHAPQDPAVRHAQAFFALADGDAALAARLWQGLLDQGPPVEGAFRRAVLVGLNAARARLGEAPVAAAPQPPGPSADDMAAAQAMSPQERQAMIEGMVGRLADRLKSEPGDTDGWIRLGRAYEVLGRFDAAAAAWDKAAALRPEQPELAASAAAARAKASPP